MHLLKCNNVINYLSHGCSKLILVFLDYTISVITFSDPLEINLMNHLAIKIYSRVLVLHRTIISKESIMPRRLVENKIIHSESKT